MSGSQERLRITLSKFYPIFGDLCNGLKDWRYRAKAGNLAALLLLVYKSLESLPPGWDSEEVEQRCQNLLTDLAEFCNSNTMKDKSEAWPQLRKFFEKKDQHHTQNSWRTLFSQESKERAVENLIRECKGLIHECFPFNVDSDLVNALPDWVYQKRPHDCSVHFNAGLYDLLQHYAICGSKAHCLTSAVEQSHYSSRHLSRLCLDSCDDDPRGNDDIVTSLDLLISSIDLSYWQEVRLKIQGDHQRRHRLEQLFPGKLCEVLGNRSNSRVFLSFHDGTDSLPAPESKLYILKDQGELQAPYESGKGIKLSEALVTYELSMKDKIALAHTIVLAYWKLYGSNLTHAGWTSDNIYFMCHKEEDEQDHTLPLISYLTLPFDATPTKWPAHQQGDNAPFHPCPPILSIGIILLEIARCKYFPVKLSEGSSGTIHISRTNKRQQLAKIWLQTLRRNREEHFRHKDMFFAAVEKCLEFKGFEGDQTGRGKYMETTTREEFYLKVVCPLAYLAEFAFKTRHGGRAHRKKPVDKKPPPLHAPRTVFHTGQPLDAEDWLQNLKKICTSVEEHRRMHGVSRPIKVALLDTGCDFGLIPSKRKFMVNWKDFTEESKASAEDSFGHGSLMARLILECSPSAKIIVARIAKDMAELEGSEAKVAKAIRWAVGCGANIVSMSFGFPRDHHEISRAIDEVKLEHPVIFLSSAGNSRGQEESFPARLSSVISIYAANYNGTFSESNAMIKRGHQTALSTFGDNIPPHIRTEFGTRFPGILFKPSSSIATAIAAGICATMLAYITVLPKLLDPPWSRTHLLQWTWETEGMEAVLRKAMSWSQAGQDQKSFLDPAWFWQNHPCDVDRFCSIWDSLVSVDLKGELRRK